MNRYNTHNTHKHTRRTHINTHVTHTQHSTHTSAHTHTHTHTHNLCYSTECTLPTSLNAVNTYDVLYIKVIQHFMSVLKLSPFPSLKCNEHLHEFAQDYQILVLYQYHFNTSIKQPLIGNSTLNAFVAYIYQTSISLSQAVSTLRASVSHSPLWY